MNLVQAAILWYVVGHFVFLIQADFSLYVSWPWDDVYYVWEKGKDVLLFGAIIDLLPKNYRWIIKPIFVFAIILFIWQLISLITTVDTNHPLMVTVAFTVLLTGVIIVLLKNLIKCSRKL